MATAGSALSLEAVTAIDGAIAGWLEGDFGCLAAGGAGSREHLAGSAKAPTAAAAAATTVAAAATTAAATAPAGAATGVAAAATAASAVAAGLGGLAGFAASLAALGFVGKATIREPLLLIRSESELGAAIDAHNGFVLKRHNVLHGKNEEERIRWAVAG